MALEGIAFAPERACMVVRGRDRGRDEVSCPHCGEVIALQEAGAQDGRLSVQCPRCAEESLLVRVVSVLQHAVQVPKELLTQLGRDLEVLAQPVEPSVRTPAGVYTLSVSRGARLVLAMMWHCAERTGSRTVATSVAQLSRRLTTSRGMVRRWLGELVEVGVVRELSGAGKSPRVWELLPIAATEEEVGRG